MKLLHVVENLDKGAVENWLVNVFLESRKYRPDWEWTFYCILGKEGRLDDTVRAAGGKIIYSPYWLNQKGKFLRSLRHAARQEDYDILHVHHDYLSGFYLLATAGIKFKRRILHIHNTDEGLPVANRFLHGILLRLFRYSAIRFSDLVVGISRDTLAAFVKGSRKRPSRILYYGIDLQKFAADGKGKRWLRKELGWPADARILLFTGRMNAMKNPGYVIDILQGLQTRRGDVYALFVGRGGEEPAVLAKSKQYGLQQRIHLAGWRNDVADIMQESDVFVFPRVEFPREGLGLVVVEAQSAGLPMALSNGIVEDAIVIPSLARFIPLKDDPKEWVAAIDELLTNGKPLSGSEALALMEASAFSLPNATENLLSLYEQPLS